MRSGPVEIYSIKRTPPGDWANAALEFDQAAAMDPREAN
jgi:hypothetical protein